MYGAGNEIRTRDLNIGKVALYQLSYSRGKAAHYGECGFLCQQAILSRQSIEVCNRIAAKGLLPRIITAILGLHPHMLK